MTHKSTARQYVVLRQIRRALLRAVSDSWYRTDASSGIPSVAWTTATPFCNWISDNLFSVDAERRRQADYENEQTSRRPSCDNYIGCSYGVQWLWCSRCFTVLYHPIRQTHVSSGLQDIVNFRQRRTSAILTAHSDAEHCPSVLWYCWLGFLPVKTVSHITYTVLAGT